MDLQKINWKLCFAKPEAATPTLFFKLFNTWIPNSSEVFVDVADYAHVHDGPLTILVGHYTDYILDDSDGRRGLVYSRKQLLTGTSSEKWRQTFKEMIHACLRIEQDPAANGLTFSTASFDLIVNDRAVAPNTAATFKAIEADLLSFAETLYGKGNVTLKHLDDPKRRFSVRLTGKTVLTLQKLFSTL